MAASDERSKGLSAQLDAVAVAQVGIQPGQWTLVTPVRLRRHVVVGARHVDLGAIEFLQVLRAAVVIAMPVRHENDLDPRRIHPQLPQTADDETVNLGLVVHRVDQHDTFGRIQRPGGNDAVAEEIEVVEGARGRRILDHLLRRLPFFRIARDQRRVLPGVFLRGDPARFREVRLRDIDRRRRRLSLACRRKCTCAGDHQRCGKRFGDRLPHSVKRTPNRYIRPIVSYNEEPPKGGARWLNRLSTLKYDSTPAPIL